MAKNIVETKLVSYVTAITKELEAESRKQRRKAAAYGLQKIRQNARKHKDTGNYIKGLYTHHTQTASYVGVRAPHAYLVEFGTEERQQKSGKSVGVMPALGLIYGTLREESGTMEQIMSEPYIR